MNYTENTYCQGAWVELKSIEQKNERVNLAGATA